MSRAAHADDETRALDAISRALLALVDNQSARTAAVFGDMSPNTFCADPGGNCNSIQRIGRHLVLLRQFQMRLLGSPLADEIDYPEKDETVETTVAKINLGTDLLRRAIREHDPGDWERAPTEAQRRAREGQPWPDDPTLVRFVRPLNDFTNHLGSIRAIRRILGDPTDQVQ